MCKKTVSGKSAFQEISVLNFCVYNRCSNAPMQCDFRAKFKIETTLPIENFFIFPGFSGHRNQPYRQTNSPRNFPSPSCVFYLPCPAGYVDFRFKLVSFLSVFDPGDRRKSGSNKKTRKTTKNRQRNVRWGCDRRIWILKTDLIPYSSRLGSAIKKHSRRLPSRYRR